jgi:hypothetical protein
MIEHNDSVRREISKVISSALKASRLANTTTSDTVLMTYSDRLKSHELSASIESYWLIPVIPDDNDVDIIPGLQRKFIKNPVAIIHGHPDKLELLRELGYESRLTRARVSENHQMLRLSYSEIIKFHLPILRTCASMMSEIVKW